MHKLSLSLLVLLSSSALANDAVLNVEGEIQINGKTVINNQGQFVGAGVVKPDDYWTNDGTYTYSRYNNSDNRLIGKEVFVVNGKTETSYLYDLDAEGNEILSSTWQIERLPDGKRIETSEYFSAYNPCESVIGECVYLKKSTHYNEYTVEFLTMLPDYYSVGTTATELTKAAYTNSYSIYEHSDGTQERVEHDLTQYTSRWDYSYGGQISKYSLGELNFENCIIAENSIRCPGVGNVEYTWGDSWDGVTGRLVSYEQTPALRTSANQAEPVSYREMVKRPVRK